MIALKLEILLIKLDRQFLWERINISIHRPIGNLKNTHVGDHQRVHTSEGPKIRTLAIHTSEPYPYIGMLAIHTSKSEVHTSEHAIHTLEDSPYMGASMYGPSSDVWTCLYAPSFYLWNTGLETMFSKSVLKF